uniref:hypothetical protein n=1 Tax=Paenibacillus ginsengihumi TaxID=431596 RepID=UPI0004773CAF
MSQEAAKGGAMRCWSGTTAERGDVQPHKRHEAALELHGTERRVAERSDTAARSGTLPRRATRAACGGTLPRRATRAACGGTLPR